MQTRLVNVLIIRFTPYIHGLFVSYSTESAEQFELGSSNEVDCERPSLRCTATPERKEASLQRLQDSTRKGGEG